MTGSFGINFCKGRALKAMPFSNWLTQNIALLIGKWYNVGGGEKGSTFTKKSLKPIYLNKQKDFILHGKSNVALTGRQKL